jgi:NAD+ kinase
LEKDAELKNTIKLIDHLKSFECEIFMDNSLNLNYNKKINFISYEELFKSCEIIITLGGDGTMLHIAHLASKNECLVLGINLGNIGYLTELEFSELEKISRLFTNDFFVEKRMMIDVLVQRKENIIFESYALNDVVITYGGISRIINLSLFCDDKKVTNYRSDGIIICTPTGSTAYSLSAGGPIIEPRLSAITVTPICAHSLTSKSIVFSDSSVLEIKVPFQRADVINLNVDGMNNLSLEKEDIVIIKKSLNQMSLIRINNLSFYETLNKKFSESGNIS